MLLRNTLRTSSLRPLLTPTFSRTLTTRPPTANRTYDPIRDPTSLSTLLTLTTSTSIPLLTLWTASYIPLCARTSTLLHHLLVSERVGEAQGGVAYAEVEFDSPILGGEVRGRYGIPGLPCLLAFDGRGEAKVGGMVCDERELADEGFLRLWVEGEAGGGGRGVGGFGIAGTFGLGKGGVR